MTCDVHTWVMAGHWNGCHDWGITDRCTHCNAVRSLRFERVGILLVGAWMDPNCTRCCQLSGGADPLPAEERVAHA